MTRPSPAAVTGLLLCLLALHPAGTLADQAPTRGSKPAPPSAKPVATRGKPAAAPAKPAAKPADADAKPVAEGWPTAAQLATRRRDAETRRLFQTAEPLSFTIVSDFKAIDRDRNPASTKTFPGTISIVDAAGNTVTRPLKLRGRGHSRRNPKVCDFVPLRLEFDKNEIKGTEFDGHSALKLGTHCRSVAVFEQYVLREYTAYRIMNLLSPRSFRVRLARGTYIDSTSQKTLGTRWAMFAEDDDDVARRQEGRITDQPQMLFRHMNADYLGLMTMFEYMIGNTDVSIATQHNVKVVETPANVRYPVPYDFDYSGLVNTTYAVTDKIFNLQSVRQRLYRGPCRTPEELEGTFARFRSVRADIYKLYDEQPAFTEASRQDARKFLDGFYQTIDRPDEVKRVFIDGCVKPGM